MTRYVEPTVAGGDSPACLRQVVFDPRPITTFVCLLIARDCSGPLRASAWLALSPYLLKAGMQQRPEPFLQ